MAKKPATAHADALPPAMDYAQHNATYSGFMNMVKYGIASMALLVLSLYAFIEAGQPIIGVILLLLIPVGIIGMAVMGSRRSA
jgi:hypothetical protein